MSANNATCAQLVRKLIATDSTFASDHEDDVQSVEEYPDAVMADFAAHLCHRFDAEGEDYGPILLCVLQLTEKELVERYDEVQNIVEVGLIEMVFLTNRSLLTWMLHHSEAKLRYEILAFKTLEKGYRIAGAIRSVFGDSPPHSTADMLDNPLFIHALQGASVEIEDGLRDEWRNPYCFRTRILAESKKRLVCVSSLASLRGEGEDIEACA
jgi:hypothetical protein